MMIRLADYRMYYFPILNVYENCFSSEMSLIKKLYEVGNKRILRDKDIFLKKYADVNNINLTTDIDTLKYSESAYSSSLFDFSTMLTILRKGVLYSVISLFESGMLDLCKILEQNGNTTKSIRKYYKEMNTSSALKVAKQIYSDVLGEKNVYNRFLEVDKYLEIRNVFIHNSGIVKPNKREMISSVIGIEFLSENCIVIESDTFIENLFFETKAVFVELLEMIDIKVTQRERV